MAGSLPELMAFYEEHKSKRDQFEILAFHNPRAKDLKELDEKLKKIRARHWEGQSLPFPILLDASGQTIRQWGIQAFPTEILINPEGKLVPGGLEELKQQLR